MVFALRSWFFSVVLQNLPGKLIGDLSKNICCEIDKYKLDLVFPFLRAERANH